MGQHAAHKIWSGPSTTRPKSHGMCLARHEPTGRAWATLQPVGRHGPAREAGGPLRHDGRHGPLVARPIKGMTHPAWSIIVVMYQVLLWSCIKYSNIMVIIFCWFKNSCKNEVFTCFLSTGCSWHGGPNGHASTTSQMGWHGLNKGMSCCAWAEPPARGPARHDPIYYPGRSRPSSQARA
jgi:hypothetical protein